MLCAERGELRAKGTMRFCQCAARGFFLEGCVPGMANSPPIAGVLSSPVNSSGSASAGSPLLTKNGDKTKSRGRMNHLQWKELPSSVSPPSRDAGLNGAEEAGVYSRHSSIVLTRMCSHYFRQSRCRQAIRWYSDSLARELQGRASGFHPGFSHRLDAISSDGHFLLPLLGKCGLRTPPGHRGKSNVED